MDASLITDRLYLGGGITTSADVAALVLLGITHVIDMRAEFDDHTIFVNDGVQVCWLPQQDDGTPRPADQINSGISFALDALRTVDQATHKHLNKVYVHCAAGVNRGPTEMYAIIRSLGFSQDDAINLIKTKRPQVNFYNVKNYVDSVNSVFG